MSSSTLDLTFRTDDSSRWGSGQTTPLRADQVDMNFWILLQQVLALESNPVQPNEIASITSDGSALTITMADSSTFGPFTLPVADFEWRDVWTPSTDYHKWDLFETTTGLFVVVQAHTSNLTFNSADGNVAGPYYKLLIAFPVTLDIGFFVPGQPGTGIDSGLSMLSYLCLHPLYLKAGLADSLASVEVAFTTATTFDIQQNGTVIGSVNFGAGATQGTFTFATDTQFVAGDFLRVMSPASIDATAKNLNVSFAAIKGSFEGPSSS